MSHSERKKVVQKRVLYRNQVLPKLREALHEQGLASYEVFDDLQQKSTWLDSSLEELLVSHAEISEEALLDVLSKLSGIERHSIVSQQIEEEALALVSAEAVVKYHIIPLRIDGDDIILATDRVHELNDEDDLRILLGYGIRWRLSTLQEVEQSIKYFYGAGLRAFLGFQELLKEDGSEGDVFSGAPDISQFVESIIVDAMQMKASDIHFELTENSLRLRYRIDGVLNSINLPEGVGKYRGSIITRIKVMAQMNIAEKRLPKDGRFSIRYGHKMIDVRASVMPARHGEEASLRLLNRDTSLMSIQELGLSPDQQSVYEHMLTLSHGLVLFTGPTGSGKSTSLYACMEHLRSQQRKVVTLEDPIEYEIEGITQIQINPAIDFTFAKGLRSVLRHDPDVILVGEIRDNETAEIAVSAAMTGHLVFSTLHTNDSVGALNRLIDMGVDRFLVSSSVECVVAQRLIRQVCSECREEVPLDTGLSDTILQECPDLEMAPATVKQGAGCPYCRFTGYEGRQSLFEVMPITDALRGLIMNEAPSSALMNQACKEGLIKLRATGWKAVIDGKTTVEEIFRVTQ